MNDFTKEELEFIALSIDSVTLEDNEIELHHNLFHKLQDMIHNYCEHKWQMNNQLKCNECGVTVG